MNGPLLRPPLSTFDGKVEGLRVDGTSDNPKRPSLGLQEKSEPERKNSSYYIMS